MQTALEHQARSLVLDTHVLVWLAEGSPRLGVKARRTIERTMRTSTVLVCAISFWEIAALERRGRLALSVPVRALRGEVLEMGIRERAVDGDLGIAAALLDWQHKDPADRLIAAATESLQGRLATADRDLLEWAGTRRSVDARK